MKAFWGKTLSVTRSLVTKLTANDNYDPDSLAGPMEALVEKSIEDESYAAVVDKAVRAAHTLRDYFKSESFQFKE